MGEEYLFQPLTREDKVSVVIYRTGIAVSSVIIALGAYVLGNIAPYQNNPSLPAMVNIAIIALYSFVGLSVFFIHLYISKIHRVLKKLYYISVIALLLFFIIGKGDAVDMLVNTSYAPLLLIPVSVCLGFITAKEAFCFKLFEGYLLAIIMPLYLLLLSTGKMQPEFGFYGLLVISAVLIFFTLRKVFMPLHYDIGDKSAYT